MMTLILAFVMLMAAAPAHAAVTRYATSTARGALSTGTCLTTATRCTLVRALSLSAAGDTVIAEGNTSTSPYVYQGANDMLVPPTGVTGNSLAPITVQCDVGGGCLLDGQFVAGRIPISLAATNNYFIIEDFNAKNGTLANVRTQGSNNIIRRVVAWDIQFDHTTNGLAMFACYNDPAVPGSSVNNVFEDVAGFGMGTWAFSHSQNKQGACTFRRAWGRFEGTATGSNVGAAFGGLWYKALSTTCDNCIGEYFPNIGTVTFTVINPGNVATPCPLVGSDRVCSDGAPYWPGGAGVLNRWLDVGDTTCASNQTLCNQNGFMGGSFFYARSTANLARMGTALAFFDVPAGRIGGGITFQNVLYWVDPAHAQFLTQRVLDLNERLTSPDLPFTRISTVGGIANIVDTVDSSGDGSSGVWVPTNPNPPLLAASLAALNAASANPWTGTVGANLCYRYVDRVRQDGTGGTTAQPLWPWPMNQRIIDAMNIAGAYTGSCTGCTGTFPTRTSVDVTATVESLLGTIPSTCRTDAAAPTFPPATGFNPATLSTF